MTRQLHAAVPTSETPGADCKDVRDLYHPLNFLRSTPIPIVDEELPRFALLQRRFTEAAECMKAHAGPPHLLEYGLQAIPEEVLRGQHRVVLRLDEEPTSQGPEVPNPPRTRAVRVGC